MGLNFFSFTRRGLIFFYNFFFTKIYQIDFEQKKCSQF
jgi:hypothetical protein